MQKSEIRDADSQSSTKIAWYKIKVNSNVTQASLICIILLLCKVDSAHQNHSLQLKSISAKKYSPTVFVTKIINKFEVDDIFFSPDSRLMACKSSDESGLNNSILIWDVLKNKIVEKCNSSSYAISLAFDPTDKNIADIESSNLSSDNNYDTECVQVAIRDIYSHKIIRLIKHSSLDGEGITYSQDGKFLVVADSVASPRYEPIVKLFDTKTWKLIHVFKGFDDGHISAVAISPDTSLIAGISVAGEVDQGQLIIWKRKTGKAIEIVIDQDNPFTQAVHRPLFWVNDKLLICGNRMIAINGNRKIINISNNASMKYIAKYNTNSVLATNNRFNSISLLSLPERKITKFWVKPDKHLQLEDFFSSKSLLATIRNKKEVIVWRLE